MLSTALTASPLAADALVAGHHWGAGFGAPWLFFLIPLFWIGVVALIVGLAGRRWRRAGWAGRGFGPGGPGFGPWAYAAQQGAQAARGAETTLAERFAQGDIDETEYRARLEVIRANAPQPPVPPQA